MNKKPKKGEYLEVLLRSSKTVLSTKDVALLWGESNNVVITNRLKKYVQVGKLIRVRRGLYVKDSMYNHLELATRIYTPSYISFETVLSLDGVNFQYYGNLFVASYLSRDITVDKQKVSFIKMKDYVLSNTLGIKHIHGVAIATKERAFLDRIYVSKEYHFDTMGNLDWDKVFEMLPMYHNKRMEKKVKVFFDHYKSLQ